MVLSTNHLWTEFKMLKLKHKLQDEAGGEEGGSAGKFTQADIDKAIADTRASFEGHKNELLTETKKAKADLEAFKKEMQGKDEKRAKEQGEYQGLYETRTKELEEANLTIANLKNAERDRVKGDLAGGVAIKLAGALGDNAVKTATQLLASDVAVSDKGEAYFEIGGVKVDSDTIMNRFKENHPYLVAGSQAQGAGGKPSQNGGAGGKTITREQFDGMSHSERSSFFKSGGKVAD